MCMCIHVGVRLPYWVLSKIIAFGLHGIFGQFLPVNRALFVIVIGFINIYNQLNQFVELDNDEVVDI